MFDNPTFWQNTGKTKKGAKYWKFSYTQLPDEPLRPAMAELPLPDTFFLTPQDILSFYHRVILPQGATTYPNPKYIGAYFDVYIRTENGNLYTTQPSTWSSANIRPYTQFCSSFTMGFYGRAKLPWPFFENKPISLVFYFRSRVLPTSYEIIAPELIQWRD